MAIPRANVPSVDLMVSDVTGQHCFSIQVKTSSGAKRTFKRNPGNDRWEFDVGEKAKQLRGPNLIYAFVDLNWGDGVPKVFVVPSEIVFQFFNDGVTRLRYMMWIDSTEEEAFSERWDLIAAVP